MTEAAGLGPSGHPSVWRPRSLASPPPLSRGEGLRWPLPSLFLPGTLDRGGWG